MKIIAFAALAALSAPAFAETVPFSGGFVGVQGGWQQDRQRLDVTGTSAGVPYASQFRDSQSGVAYGGQVGFDFKLSPNFVLGLEAAATGRTGTDGTTDSFGNTYRLKTGRTFDGTARLGYLLSPDSLLYVRGGYSNAKFIADLNTSHGSINKGGYVAGVGYEQYLASNISARIEYDYSKYGSDDLSNTVAGSGLTSASARYTRNAVKAGVNLHF